MFANQASEMSSQLSDWSVLVKVELAEAPSAANAPFGASVSEVNETGTALKKEDSEINAGADALSESCIATSKALEQLNVTDNQYVLH